MSFKSILREFTRRNGIGNKKKEQIEEDGMLSVEDLLATPESQCSYALVQQNPWANMARELLHDIIGRVDANETTWPARRAMVSCASVCKSWRKITKEIIRTPEECGVLTFPMSLKQPGPRDSPIQCFIRRERGTSTYRLYLGLSPALSRDSSKLLLAAKRVRKATKTDFILSLSGNDFSNSGGNYAGKLRSNFFGSKFMIQDFQTPSNSAVQHHGWLRKKISMKKVSPRLPLYNYKVATISYELNVLRTRGPRRMHCIMHTIPISEIRESGNAFTPATFSYGLNETFYTSTNSGSQTQNSVSTTFPKSSAFMHGAREPLVLSNKTPRWHEQLQCWCLNFRGRVTVASVKNFQLVAVVNPSQNSPAPEQEKVILQFGKIGKDIFTMDYQYPLSAFQAFAICLSSFDTKPA